MALYLVYTKHDVKTRRRCLDTDVRALSLKELQEQPPGPGRNRVLAVLQ
jgi:hypothetical protein